MNSMNAYATPQLISSLFLLSLGIVSLLSGRKERLWRIFSAFCFLLMFGAWFAFLIASGKSELGGEFVLDKFGLELDFVSLHARLAPVFGFLSIMLAIFYSVAVIGMPMSFKVFGKDILFDFSDDRFTVKIFGWKISERVYLFTTVIAAVTLSFVFIHATTEVSLTSMGNWPGLEVKYSSLGYILAVFVFIGIGKIIYFLIYGYRINKDANYRSFIRLNIIAFILTYGSAMTLGVILPLFDMPTQLYASSLFPLSVVIFYVAIMRYQFARVEELNVNLERKVEERTSELKDAFTRMVQSEKMASLGQLVAGVAHEINNPVSAISSSQQSMTRSVAKLTDAINASSIGTNQSNEVSLSLEVLKKTSNVITDGSKRIAGIVSKLKSFAKLDEAELQNVDINHGIKETLALLDHEFNNRIVVNQSFGSLPNITCNPRQLNQLWLNLLINASEAQQNGAGEINITTSREESAISVSIEDSGRGIGKDDLKQVFDPGFTTKSRGTGTGLGLAICYQIVEAHKGKIEVKSQIGKGTKVTVSLPENS
ncbi:MAG: hypothetical protein HN356_06770 [Calditrichaeota bacterium]|nr:hypothetical protein [Calditrichota bacterium]MBT7617544.1 hypothetical protein [Calditrichota bacterium]MBT7788524.1 hypothetical protein [Calditrichota bacterium]